MLVVQFTHEKYESEIKNEWKCEKRRRDATKLAVEIAQQAKILVHNMQISRKLRCKNA